MIEPAFKNIPVNEKESDFNMKRWAEKCNRTTTNVFVASLAFTLISAFQSPGCGLDWRLPTNHFDGVNNQGYVAYWEKVNDLDLGDGLKIPIFIGFRSNKENGIPSPYLGQGWILPLLEASIVQTGDNTFLMMQPDGWNNFFLRNNSGETVLQGSAGWKAQINNDTITAWAPCGWKLTFYKGHIQSITTPKNRILEFIYSGGVVTEIRENGTSKLTVERTANEEASAIAFNGKRMQVILGQKPRVLTIAGKNVVGGIDRSLKSINQTDGDSKTFECAVNDKIQPTFKVTRAVGSDRLFTWDPATKWIISDNDWIYKITRTGAWNPGIERTNSRKQTEYWLDDREAGKEVIVTATGLERIVYRFTSGILSGRVRSAQEKMAGTLVCERRIMYDENGNAIRETYKEYDKGVCTFERTLGQSIYNDVKKIANRKKILISEIAASQNAKSKDIKLYELASLFILADGDPSSAKQIVNQITDDDLKVSVLLQTLFRDRERTWNEKVQDANELSKKFPNQTNRILKLIAYYNLLTKHQP